jgi:hypothetical protein
MLEPVSMARKHKSGKAPILTLDCMISQVSCGLDNLNVSATFRFWGNHNIWEFPCKKNNKQQ